MILALCISLILLPAAFFWRSVDSGELFREAVNVASGPTPQEAVPLLDEVIQLDPENSKALLYRGQLAADAGELDTAIEFFRRVTKPRDDAATARYMEASVWLRKHRARDAEAIMRSAIELLPGFIKPRESLIQLYYMQARSAELTEQLAELRRYRHWNLEELFASQLAWIESSLPLENVDALRNFVAADADDINSRIALARHYITHDQHSEAAELLADIDWQEGTNLSGSRLTVHGLLAACSLKSANLNRAWEQLKQAPAAMDNPHHWWRSLGQVAFEAEAWSEAQAALACAVRGNINDYESLYLLGLAIRRSGDQDTANHLLERARNTEKLATTATIFLKTSRDRRDVISALVLDIGKLLLALQRPDEGGLWLSAFLGAQPRHAEGLELLERASTTAPRARDTHLSFGPELMSRIATAIEAKAPSETQRDVVEHYSKVRLRDISDEVGLDFHYFNGKDERELITQTVGGGTAVLDYDNDGWPDLFFPNGQLPNQEVNSRSALTDQLWRNHRGTHTRQTSQSAGVAGTEFGQGCTAFDYDNDGFQDLFVGTLGRMLTYRNQGDGTFVRVPELGINDSQWTSSIATADLDRDGDLDLYAVSYLKNPFSECHDDEGRSVVCSPANFDAEQDQLYLNNGQGHFGNATEGSGIVAPNGKGLGVIIADFDRDGWQDVYVANDGEQNFLFRNSTPAPGDEVQFSEVGLTSGSSVSGDGRAQAGMGIACEDFNHDGWPDLYVTNFYQDYNTLYLNHGALLFSDATESAELVEPTMKALGFGAQAIDFDLDGFAEIFVANGHIHDRRFEGTPWQMSPQCFRRSREGTYQEISQETGPYFKGKYIGRGVARIDFNKDLLPDVVVVHQDRPSALMRNESENPGNALVLDLRGVQSNRDAIGASIEVDIGTKTRTVEVTAGDGYYVSNQRSVIVGLGRLSTVPKVTIRWPSGHVDQLENLPVNEGLTVIEARGYIRQ